MLGGGAKIGDYIPTYPDAAERFDLAAQFLVDKGYKNVAIVSHSLGATMANQYLIKVDKTPVKAWVFIGIINGLEEMFRIKIPVMDVYGSKDWEINQVGAYERKKQIDKVPGSEQVVVKDALHFFEGREADLADLGAGFLDRVFHQATRPRRPAANLGWLVARAWSTRALPRGAPTHYTCRLRLEGG